jgi:hypothetical protein
LTLGIQKSLIPQTPGRIFRELERLLADARHNEASELLNAERKGAVAEREKWQGVVADKDAALAEKDAMIADLRARFGEDS